MSQKAKIGIAKIRNIKIKSTKIRNIKKTNWRRWRKAEKRCIKGLETLLIIGLGIVFCMPVFLLAAGSLADSIEWKNRTEAFLEGTEGYIRWNWIPDFPTLEQYQRLLFYMPQFFVLFWNSIKITTCILLGQLIISVSSAWGFAKYEFWGKKVLFSLYIILMLLPFQVTMLSKYLVLNRFGMLDTHSAIILPAIFSTFPVFLIYRSFTAVPMDLLEAARIDGAGEIKIFFKIGLPLAQGGILAAMILSFLECWNMMEEPLAFLKEKALWPLSLYLPEISMEQAGFSCAASIITLMVSLFIFGIFRDSLEQGIIASAIKE